MLIHTEERQGFTIALHALPEDTAPDFDDAEEVIAGIESGKYEWFIAKVTASKEGIELGADFLGGCCYNSYMEFVEHNDYYADMVDNALSEAQETLAKLCPC